MKSDVSNGVFREIFMVFDDSGRGFKEISWVFDGVFHGIYTIENEDDDFWPI